MFLTLRRSSEELTMNMFLMHIIGPDGRPRVCYEVKIETLRRGFFLSPLDAVEHRHTAKILCCFPSRPLRLDAGETLPLVHLVRL